MTAQIIRFPSGDGEDDFTAMAPIGMSSEDALLLANSAIVIASSAVMHTEHGLSPDGLQIHEVIQAMLKPMGFDFDVQQYTTWNVYDNTMGSDTAPHQHAVSVIAAWNAKQVVGAITNTVKQNKAAP